MANNQQIITWTNDEQEWYHIVLLDHSELIAHLRTSQD